jgi:hypothetical protein
VPSQKELAVRIGASLALIAIGAILKWAVTDSVNGVNLGVIGVILMVVGAIGLIVTGIFMSTRRRTDVVVHEDPYGRSTTTQAPRY